jgi:HAD superfamily hydrolase (TIGR01509 family)
MSAILFDMDGTLIDSEPLWLESEIEIMAELGCHWDQQDQINCLGGPMEKTENYMQERSNNIKPFGYFAKQLDDVMEQKLATKLDLIPNALEILNECKKSDIKIALVTASTGRLMRAVLKRFPAGIFDTTVSYDDVKRSKPDPEPYLLAAKTLGVEIKNCVVLEDSLTGVQSGLTAGAQVIGLPHLVQMSSNPNLRVIESLSEINIEKLITWYPFLTSRIATNDR